MENEKQKQLQIELMPEVAAGVYSNLAVVANTPSEFVMDFIAMLPGIPKAEVRSRVIMTPEHAKRLLFALQERVNGYEHQFGTINLHQPEQKGRTIAPFGTGEA